ncbi:hypothetical protein T4D_7311 [Trichinella pseudospiralis]|uniref:Uncharacterized protein n=1 Tax=Trichinella pseudospiralis TaxID=6337 RepID=A0A0V1DMZ9_TRIPS|nr:hypothetical protein T4D_7311 [Trichinella pseudospiralis]
MAFPVRWRTKNSNKNGFKHKDRRWKPSSGRRRRS